MTKATTQRKTADPVGAAKPTPVIKPAPSGDGFVARLAKARTANEMTSLIGLKPIKGRSGPKIAY